MGRLTALQVEDRKKIVIEGLAMRLNSEQIATMARSRKLEMDSSTVRRWIRLVRKDGRNYFHDLAKENYGYIFRMNMEGFDRVINQLWIQYARAENVLEANAVLKNIGSIYKDYTIALQDGPMVTIVEEMMEKLRAAGKLPMR